MASKGLNFDTWLGSIDDGRKGDVFTLFRLCMLQDVHATVHLRNGKYWTSMNKPSCDHYINMEHSHIHLAYLGCGLYIELVKRDLPLQIITGASKDLIVLGTLESEERSILDSALNQGLGIALDHTTRVGTPQHVQVKTEPSPIPPTSPKPTTSSDPNVPSEPSTSTTPSEKVNIQAATRGKSHLVKAQSKASVTKLHKSLHISINKMDIQEGVRVNVTTDMLAKLPISVLHDESSTEGYVSTETEIYWPISPKPAKASKISEGAIPDKTDKPTSKQRDSKSGRGSLQSKKRMIYTKPSQFMFRIRTFGIKKKKPKYHFKCVAENCSKMFDKLQTWNTHHRIHHKTLIECTVCWKSFKTPSMAQSHKNSHAPWKHKCTQCSKTFAYGSALWLHKNTHVKQKRHKCFHGNCRKSYRWPQDLSRHIQRHLNMSWSCGKCDFITYEKRLLKRHRAAHANFYKYKCKKCTYKSKWPTPFARHQKRCKGPIY